MLNSFNLVSGARPSVPLSQTETRTRLSSPAPGRSLGGAVTRAERPVRDAIRALTNNVVVDPDAFASVFDCTVFGPAGEREPDDVRLAWFLINVALTHAFVMSRERASPFQCALEWFCGDLHLSAALLACFSSEQLRAAEAELRRLDISEDLLDLLPYVIEPHGHVTRNQLETSAIAKKTRNLKKGDGVYYTPSDVAQFMVGSLASLSGGEGTWLDPACGTGVFLRAAISCFRKCSPSSSDLKAYIASNIFGIDKSALATDLAAFVLLTDCALAFPQEYPLFGLWRQLKRNIVCMDALRLIPSGGVSSLHRDPARLTEIEDVFPSVSSRGFDHVVMNPPYATASMDESLQAVWHSYQAVTIGQSVDIHLAFTEMLWRFTSEKGVSAAVLPLSVGANTTKSYTQLRSELLRTSGTKEFLFFDREPQALFGEDIKTRNLILICHGPANATSVQTSRLLKWTAEQRPLIFSRDRLVKIDSPKSGSFIPKVGTRNEALSYSKLTSPEARLAAVSFVPRIGKISLDDALGPDSPIDGRTVLVSSTAYNFLNCFFIEGLPTNPSIPYSSSPVTSLRFECEWDAYTGFSLLSSRLCFWLWHVEGDGFHVTNEFIRRSPLWSVFRCEALKNRLSEYGKSLWRAALGGRAGTINGGKQTYSFHTDYDHPIALDLELMVLEHLGLDNDFSRSLSEFVRATVSIDGKCRTRRPDVEFKEVA